MYWMCYNSALKILNFFYDFMQKNGFTLTVEGEEEKKFSTRVYMEKLQTLHCVHCPHSHV